MSTHRLSPEGKQVTTKQHVFARSGLVRFAGPGGKLEVLHLPSGEKRHHGANAPPFVVNRCWDQRSEAGLMNRIERDFGIVATHTLRANLTTLDAPAHAAVTRMFSLWKVRGHRANNPLPDFSLAGAGPERVVSDDEMDRGEHFGVISIRPDGRIPGRMLAGPLLQLVLDRQVASMTGKRWGIVRASDGEFLLPDSFGDFMVMPLTPKCCFIAEQVDAMVNRTTVADINALAKASAITYLAARDLSACPGL